MTKKPKNTAPILDATMWPIDKIIPFEKNPRTHPSEQVDLLAAMIETYGWDQAIVVDEDGVILKGHGRKLAALKNGYKQAPVVQRIGLTEQQKTEMRIADNSLALLSGWHPEFLKEGIVSLQAMDYDISLLGFPEIQLRSMGIGMGAETGNDPEETPEPPKNPVSRIGDVWVLGEHRLACGDILDPETREALLGADKADLVFTDPPYNVAYVSNGSTHRSRAIENDDMDEADFAQWIDEVYAAIASAMRPLACIYVCHPDAASGPKLAFETGFAKHFQKSETIIWVKQAAGMGFQDYRSQHEPMLYGWKAAKKGKHYFNDDRTRTTVWSISRESQLSYVHPTQKPVALVEEAIVNSSKRGWIVADFFSGSGSALIAAERLQRKFRGTEIFPGYVDVGVERWQNQTGKKAVLEATGKTFADTAKDRQRASTAAKKKTPAAKAGASPKGAPAPA